MDANTLNGMGAKLRRQFKQVLLQKQNRMCCWCSNPMVETGSVVSCRQRVTFEHLIDDWSREDGKDHSLDKIALSCAKCNNDRNSRLQQQALLFYKNKFKTAQEFHEFSRGKRPKDFIRAFGVVPQFTDELMRVTMKEMRE